MRTHMHTHTHTHLEALHQSKTTAALKGEYRLVFLCQPAHIREALEAVRGATLAPALHWEPDLKI